MLTNWLQELINSIAALAPAETFFSYPTFVKATIALFLVSLVSGSVGSMVVGNRMAFFSDALAHTAYAGVGLGMLAGVIGNFGTGSYYSVGIPVVMIVIGAAVGVGIAYVRERTGISSDTVIGVFFAAALGVGAILLSVLSRLGYFNLEAFLFGSILGIGPEDLIFLALLCLVAAGVLTVSYNGLVFSSFNPSLARSRRVRILLCNYTFIVLLALVVNLSLRVVGVMLINGLLIVPAATAGLLSRNMRQLFWLTIGLTLCACMAGLGIAWEVGNRSGFEVGIGGPIVVLSVLLFFLAMAVRPLVVGKQAG